MKDSRFGELLRLLRLRPPHRMLLPLLLAGLMIAGTCPARVNADEPDLQQITRRDGLPSNGVTALATSAGELFIGTLNGVARLRDGAIAWIETPLDDAAVTALLVDDDGALWVGSATGLARRDRDGRWHHWTAGDDGLRTAWVSALAPGGLAGTYGGGVFRWEDSTELRGFTPLGEDGPAWVTALAGNTVDLWAGSAGEGLWHWDGASWSRQMPPGTPADAMITALLLEGDSVWVGTQGGLWHYSPSEGWQRAGITEPIKALARDVDGPLAATNDTIYRLRDDGEWGQLAAIRTGSISSLATAGSEWWISTLGGGLQRWGTPVQVRTPRLPVVLVHGYDDAADLYRSQFHFLARWLRQDGWPIFYADDLTPDEPLFENARRLARTIAQARDVTGADRVLLVAHSFGGLTARLYVGSDLFQDDVAGVVTLGTPHAGVRLVYDFLARDLANGDRRPATAELLPEHVSAVERFLAERDVPWLVIAGDLVPKEILLEGLPPSDGLITTASALDVPGATAVRRPLAHGWTSSLLAAQVESYLFPEHLYRTTLLPWLTEQAANADGESREGTSSGAESPTRSAALPLPAAGQTREVLADQLIAPGETITVPVTLEAGETLHFFLTWDRGELVFDLVEPDGTRLDHDRRLLRDDVAHFELPATELRPLSLWSIRASDSGRWQAVVRNEGERPSLVRLDAIRPDAPQLSLEWSFATDEEDSVRLIAPELPGRRLVAHLQGSEFPLRPDTPGRMSALLPLPDNPGYYPVEVSDGDTTRWTILTRTDEIAEPAVAAELLPSGVAIVTATLETVDAGDYAVGLELWGTDGEMPGARAPADVRRLSAPVTVTPGALARVIWRIGPDELPAGTEVVFVRATALNADGPLVPGRQTRIERAGGNRGGE